MTDIRIELAPAYFAKYGERFRVAALRGALSAAQRGVQTIQGQIIPSRSPEPFDRGLYKAGWKASPETYGASISNAEPHALFIEGGVRAANVKPGRAMIDALTAWATRKGLVDKGDAGAARSVAFAIAKTMKKNGIFSGRAGKGLGILKELRERFLPELLAEEIKREIAREFP